MLRYFAAGGSHTNYYVFSGGNNFGRQAGSGYSTQYFKNGPLHSNTTINNPQFSHLARLQHIIAAYSSVLLGQEPPRPVKFTDNGTQVGYGRTYKHVGTGSSAISFLSNNQGHSVSVQYQGRTYELAPHSTSVLDGLGSVIYSSDKIIQDDLSMLTSNLSVQTIAPFNWKQWSEFQANSVPLIKEAYPHEQLNLTRDLTQYMYYSTTVHAANSGETTLKLGTYHGNILLVYVNDVYQGQVVNSDNGPGNVTLSLPIFFHTAGYHELKILSVSLGMSPYVDSLSAFTVPLKGIRSAFMGDQNITSQTWFHRPFLAGESIKLYTAEGSRKVNWEPISTKPVLANGTAMWYQTTFIPPDLTNKIVMLRVEGMNSGHAFINGIDIGRYWTVLATTCSSRGGLVCSAAFIEPCGNPTQIEYHIPNDWLIRNGANLLTLFEEAGGAVTRVTLTIYDDPIPRYL